ncbi:DUF3119 family protein [Pannus brasiliensis CCIBt3594]|uniref:DUF3119 family protein n=1 Tax=Pannus brasiliensis CCIBt3594 TaxID=1427578 RepID=A0AAW9QMZ3_9CHRO
MTTFQTSDVTGTIELAPDYKIPLILVISSLPVLFFLPWAGAGLSLFGLFLMLQTATIRLQFTPIALDVYRSGKQIRSFPYSEWQNWRIFWNKVPILFYFKEVNSIHFLPIIFDPRALRSCLEKYFPLEG